MLYRKVPYCLCYHAYSSKNDVKLKIFNILLGSVFTFYLENELIDPLFSKRFLTDYTLICNICENELILVFFSTASCQISKNKNNEKNAFFRVKMEKKTYF